jgi:hypothetical protein
VLFNNGFSTGKKGRGQNVNDEIQRTWKEVDMVYLKTLFEHMFGGSNMR